QGWDGREDAGCAQGTWRRLPERHWRRRPVLRALDRTGRRRVAAGVWNTRGHVAPHREGLSGNCHDGRSREQSAQKHRTGIRPAPRSHDGLRQRHVMKRAWILSAILARGVLSVAASALQAPPQGPTAAALAATKIEKVKDNLYIITGSGAEDRNAFSGGNTAVFITGGGVVIVDTKLPGWGHTIIHRIKSVTDKPLTTIINTHTHGDHTGSNAFFGTNVESIVHENTKANMPKMDDVK